MKSLVARSVLSFIVLFSISPGSQLAAQETPPPQQPTTTQEPTPPKVTEEMIVTARKREETVSLTLCRGLL